MKNMAKKSSFFKTSSLCLILSCLGMNNFKCEASLQEDERGADKRGATSSTVGAQPKSSSPSIPPELLEIEKKAERDLMLKVAQVAVDALDSCLQECEKNPIFDRLILNEANTGMDALTLYLANLSGAHKYLLAIRAKQGALITKLKQEKEEQTAYIDLLQRERERQAARIPELEDLQASREVQATPSSVVITIGSEDPAARIAELEAENKSLLERITKLEEDTEQDRLHIERKIPENRFVIGERRFNFWKPLTWYYLFFSASPISKSKV